MFITIANTIRFLHSKNIIHRDIKPENILLDENYNPVFCDFGWSIQLDFNESRDTFCGTLEYIAPEIFKGENYSKPADIWSLGVLLFEMMHGYSPFKGKNYKEVSEKVITGSLQCSDTLSQRLINLIHAILVSDPEQRPTIDSIIEECTSILEGNEIMSMKTRSHINLSIFFDAKNKVERLGTSNHESSKATNITKSTSPSFLKTAFSSFKTGKNGETSKINDFKVAFESQPQPINISTLAHKKQKGTEGSNNNDLPPELKQQFTVLKSNSNFFKTNEYKQENILSASSSEKKFSDRSGSRRMKVRVYLASGTSEEKNMDHHVNSSNQSGKFLSF
jgi:serine/threonine protein kinase